MKKKNFKVALKVTACEDHVLLVHVANYVHNVGLQVSDIAGGFPSQCFSTSLHLVAQGNQIQGT